MEDLKELLEVGRVVEIENYDVKIIGVIGYYGKIMCPHFGTGEYSIDDCNEKLIFNADESTYITKIYKNTPDGLELIWNREDYMDWSEVPVDTKVLVKVYDEDEWVKRYFAKYEDGYIYTWENGKTSWSVNNNKETSHWNIAKLAE